MGDQSKCGIRRQAIAFTFGIKLSWCTRPNCVRYYMYCSNGGPPVHCTTTLSNLHRLSFPTGLTYTPVDRTVALVLPTDPGGKTKYRPKKDLRLTLQFSGFPEWGLKYFTRMPFFNLTTYSPQRCTSLQPAKGP